MWKDGDIISAVTSSFILSRGEPCMQERPDKGPRTRAENAKDDKCWSAPFTKFFGHAKRNESWEGQVKDALSNRSLGLEDVRPLPLPPLPTHFF
jgi:hypothetical protein